MRKLGACAAIVFLFTACAPDDTSADRKVCDATGNAVATVLDDLDVDRVQQAVREIRQYAGEVEREELRELAEVVGDSEFETFGDAFGSPQGRALTSLDNLCIKEGLI